MYFRLKAKLNLNAGQIKKEANQSQTLLAGRPVNADELVLPWPFSLQHGRPEPLHMSDFYPHTKIMSIHLIETLQGAGVDNLQLFEANIVDHDSGSVINGYQVVNVLGLVSAADSSLSISRPLANVQFFEKLVLDEARAHGHLMFRLKESLTDIIIAEVVAKRVANEKFTDVFVEPL